MNSLAKSIRENIAAIVTALVVLVLICNYLFNYIPGHEKNIDAYNRARLDEFVKQFSSTVKEFANEVDKDTVKPLLKKQGIDTTNIISKLFIDSIEIHAILKSRAGVRIARRINLRQDPLYGPQLDVSRQHVADTLPLRLKLVEERLDNANGFSGWLVFIHTATISRSTGQVFMTHEIEPHESDSMLENQRLMGLDHFVIQDRRFYPKSFSIDDTRFTLVCATDQGEFEQQARRPSDMNGTILCVIVVVLLFLLIPLIKPIISSSKEKLTQLDLVSTASAIAMCTVLLSALIFTTYFSRRGSDTVKDQLAGLSAKIDTHLKNEFDHYKKNSDSLLQRIPAASCSPVHYDLDSLETHFLSANTRSFTPSLCFRMDSAGYMVMDVNHPKDFNFRRRYNDRDYFKRLDTLKPNGYYQAAVSAVFSKLDNIFKIIYLEKQSTYSYQGFTYIPKTLALDGMERSYGYLVCSKHGKVLLHSDPKKRLNENIADISRQNGQLQQVLHGYKTEPFEMEYNGEPCLFYGTRLDAGNTKELSAPLYLFTFKKLRFEDRLKIYALMRGFIISLVFSLATGFLLILYSAFFYLGHLSIFSKAHIYWLFPDKSRHAEFRLLTWLNCLAGGLPLLYLWLWPADALFFSFITGFHLAFINFILLTQRVFLISQKSPERTKGLLLLGGFMIANISPSLWLYSHAHPNLALAVSVLVYLAYLHVLKRKTFTVKTPGNTLHNYNYKGYLASLIGFCCILLPGVVVACLFSYEGGNLATYTQSFTQRKTVPAEKNISRQKSWLLEDAIFNYYDMIPQPSKAALAYDDFDYPCKASNEMTFPAYPGKNCVVMALILLGGIVLLVLLVFSIVGFYAGRFFFFELSVLYSNNKAVPLNPLTNLNFIVPPFSDCDLKKLKGKEIGPSDMPGEVSFQQLITHEGISPYKKVELILSKAFELHRRDYAKLWNHLGESEKFALYDFALDYFVNYKNRKYLASLMEKGIIVSDPLTGRLRIMNYSFRNFVIYYERVDPDFSAEETERRMKGNFAKWKLPLLIIAFGFLFLMMYLYREQYEQVVLIGGSVISTITVVAKFLNNYKK